ncbi:unnamed protein product, partial [Amoebophrya sp. A120]
GTGATGTACATHNEPLCAACTTTGFELVSGACVKNCVCPHGTAATGADCPGNG